MAWLPWEREEEGSILEIKQDLGEYKIVDSYPSTTVTPWLLGVIGSLFEMAKTKTTVRKDGEIRECREGRPMMSIGVGASPSPAGVTKPAKVSRVKKDKTKSIENFLSDVLPCLRKEMVRRKSDPFSLAPFAEYFKPDSKYIATYVLPLFRFLEKYTIVCTRYGVWDGKHQVRTRDGFDRVMYLSKNLDEASFPSDMQSYCTSRFGKEWFKIPAKDGFRAKAASSSGHQGQFTITLTGVYTDSFINSVGEEVLTINPELTYDSVRPPAPKKEKKPKVKKEKKPKAEEDGGDDDESGAVSPIGEFPGIGAQTQALSPLSPLMSDEDIN